MLLPRRLGGGGGGEEGPEEEDEEEEAEAEAGSDVFGEPEPPVPDSPDSADFFLTESFVFRAFARAFVMVASREE